MKKKYWKCLESASTGENGCLLKPRNSILEAKRGGNIYHRQSRGSSKSCRAYHRPYRRRLGRRPPYRGLLGESRSCRRDLRHARCHIRRPAHRRNLVPRGKDLHCALQIPSDYASAVYVHPFLHLSAPGSDVERPDRSRKEQDELAVACDLLQKARRGLADRGYLGNNFQLAPFT